MTDEPRRRAGGRAARVAAREAPRPEAERPIRPGLPGGAYTPLTESELQAIYDTALGLLEDLGMGQPIPEFVRVVTEAGGHVDDAGRLRYPRAVVEAAIGTAAEEFVWHGVDDDLSLEIGGNRVHFATAGAAVLMLDHETSRFRPSTLGDLFDAARLVDTLDNINIFVRTVVARDLEDTRELDLNTAFAVLAGTAKPQGTSFFKPEHVAEAVEMYDIALGEEGAFRKRPFVVANNTFVVPPLRFAEESAECMVAQVHAGVPINLLSAGQAGATSPAALAGSLTQALAECLAALTSVNLLSPGHPCVLGLWPFVSDLRTGAMSGGSGEEAVLNAAAAQLGNWLGLPSGVAAGMADSKLPDNQAGYEKALTVSLAAHAGANVIYESAGMLGSLLGHSLEALVIDNDMMGSINRTVRGIEVDDLTMSAGVIGNVIAGAQHFLGEEQTLELMQTEYTYPVIADRLSPDDWVDAGARDARQAAHDHVVATLASHHPTHLSAAAEDKIRSRFPIRLAELTR